MKKNYICITLLSMCFVSCNNGSSSENLTVSFSSTTPFVSPNDARSCQQIILADTSTPAFSKHTASFGRMTIETKKDEKFVISQIKFSFKSDSLSGGVLTCEVSSDEIDSLFKGVTNYGGTGELSVKGSYTTNSKCRVICAPIQLADENKTFRASGVAKIRGSFINSEGEETPETATAQLTIEYNP